MNLTKPKLVVSFTTIPSRFSTIENTLKSIFNQSLRPDIIYIGIPERSSRNNENLVYNTPDFLSKYQPLVQLVSLDKDYGPICKLFAALVAEPFGQECNIVTIDDDMIYPPLFLEELTSCSNQYPTSAIGSSGRELLSYPPFIKFHFSFWNNGFDFATKAKKHGDKIDFLMGITGILYKRSFFPSLDKMKEWTQDPIMYRTDDVTISAYLSTQNIDRRICHHSQEWKFTELPQSPNPLSGKLLKAECDHVRAYRKLQISEKAFKTNIVTDGWMAWIIVIIIFAIVVTAIVMNKQEKN